MVKKTKEGVVVRNKVKDTCIVVVQDRVNHKRYKKLIIKTKHYLVHDVLFDLAIGDKVLIRETRPISKKKNWVLVSVLKNSKS
jgi:small subunit ribosomal protein S17